MVLLVKALLATAVRIENKNYHFVVSVEYSFFHTQILLPAASMLQLMEVKQACCEFLQSQLHPTNCIGIKQFADIHSCTELLGYAQLYTEQHFA